jgi:hypothetical protein
MPVSGSADARCWRGVPRMIQVRKASVHRIPYRLLFRRHAVREGGIAARIYDEPASVGGWCYFGEHYLTAGYRDQPIPSGHDHYITGRRAIPH